MDKKTFFKNNAKIIFGVAAFALTLICIALETASRAFFFDGKIGYYQRGAIVPMLFIALCACFTALAAVFCFFPKLRISPDEQTVTFPVRIGALALAVGSTIQLTNSLLTLSTIIEESLVVWDMQTTAYLILPIVLKILITAHFIRVCISENPSGALNVAGNLLFIVYLVTMIVSTYFNESVAMNSPTMILLHLALVCAMMLCINEARIGLGAPVDTRRAHAFWAALSTLFCGAFSLSEAALAFTARDYPYVTQGTLVINEYYPIIFFTFVFSATRLISICFISSKNDGEQEIPAIPSEQDASSDGLGFKPEQEAAEAEAEAEAVTETETETETKSE